MEIRLDDVEAPEVVELLRQHLEGMLAQTPPESVHALDISAYKSPDVKLWTAWSNDQLLGCGGLKDLGEQHGEIKSMRTKKQYLRRGVADALLTEIINYARQAKMQRLSLETGATEHFKAAQLFYQRRGFTESAPFGSYQSDPHSLFFTLDLNA